MVGGTASTALEEGARGGGSAPGEASTNLGLQLAGLPGVVKGVEYAVWGRAQQGGWITRQS